MSLMMINPKPKSKFKWMAWLLPGFCLCFWISYGQNKQLADSLETVYLSKAFPETKRLELLSSLITYLPNPEKALKYSEDLLQQAQAVRDSDYILTAYLQKGNALSRTGDLSLALDNYLNGVKIAIDREKTRDLGVMYVSIAGVYSVMGNKANTVKYYKDAIEILRAENDSLSYASAIENLGDEYNLNFAKPDSALIYFEASGAIFEALKSEIGLAYNLGNKGLAYAQLGKNDIAEKNISQAIKILDKLGDYYPICVYLTYMADMFAERGDWATALNYAQRSLQLAHTYGLKDQISAANLKLSELHEKRNNPAVSLNYFKEYIAYRDSVKNITDVQNMANMRTDFEISQKQIEVDLLNEEKKNQQIIAIATAVALFLIGLLALGLYRRNRFIKKTTKIIEQEKERSDQLLLNILPEETANELKEKGRVEAKKFEAVTVLFTDFKGFTHYAENLDPKDLVESVGFYFTKFDEIMEKYGLEKIKTVGDAYMCAGGLPFPSNDHAKKMVLAAFEIRDFVMASKEDDSLNKGTRFEIRIGINTGPVVAGVVGSKKFSYDIWGDTVNVASRMESMSEAGRINISENTYEQVKNDFECEYRGEINVKNRGNMKMYFVNACK